MITIAKASAGSGKTYTLARTYISLLLKSKDPYAYRHILAVTFTNKATGEMKARILKELDVLSRSAESSDYFHDFVPSLCRDAEELQSRCTKMLNAILNDYSAFSIYTIDAFFQQVLRSFARELGQFESYQLEIDKENVVNESVDRLLEAISEDNTELVGWLKKTAMQQIDTKGYFDIRRTLYEAASGLQEPQFRRWLAGKGITNSDELFSKKDMLEFRRRCDAVVNDFHSKVKAAAEQMLKHLETAGITVSDCRQKGDIPKLRSYTRLTMRTALDAPTESFCKRVSDPQNLMKASAADKAAGLAEGYTAAAEELVSLFYGDSSFRTAARHFKAYSTALKVRDAAQGLGVSRELLQAFSSLLKERNILCLDDSNGLLSKIIDGSDVPFVYEKTGVKYENFLLDEFQDTSLVQWDNFRPLLAESNAGAHDNLIVGDVKQSIYRWRNSDWSLLDEKVAEEFPSSVELTDPEGRPALSRNFRTEENVVEFNNAFFESLSEGLAGMFPGEQGDKIRSIYADVRQDVHKKGGLGEVRAYFCAADKDGDAVLDKTVELIEELHGSKGAGYGDIAIVLRNNKPGEKIADALIERGVPVISDDSLTVNNSVAVRKILSVLASVENPQNRISGYLARSIGFEPSNGVSSIVSLTEEIIRCLKAKNEELVKADTVYIQAFVDWLQNWTLNNGNRLKDFLKAWEDSNNDRKSVKISSPAVDDAVRVITIHKSKGLEYPYVIIPYMDDISLFKFGDMWAEPVIPEQKSDSDPVRQFDATVRQMIFKPCISSQSEQTYFGQKYREESFAQAVDAMNLMYVAMTRAERGLYMISDNLSKEYSENGRLAHAADAVFSFVSSHTSEAGAGDVDGGPGIGFVRKERESCVEYVFGKFCSKEDMEQCRPAKARQGRYRREKHEEQLESDYPSFAPDEGRLKIDRDASDFFRPEKEEQFRLRGIVLHNILSSVVVPSDLDRAVKAAVEAGELSRKEGTRAYELLRKRIGQVADRGWFPENDVAVLNEREIVTADGEQLRPDRVLVDGDGVCIIDYKFGRHNPEYSRQLRNYAETYVSMGYASVQAYLWYLYTGEVEKII